MAKAKTDDLTSAIEDAGGTAREAIAEVIDTAGDAPVSARAGVLLGLEKVCRDLAALKRKAAAPKK